MEYQTFCKEGIDSDLYKFYKNYALDFYKDLGINPDNLRFHDHEKLAHYAKEASDIEYKFPFGWGEINGTHNRTDFDLSRHMEYSGVSQEYLDPETNEKYVPYVIESTCGLDRSVLAILFDAYKEEKINEDTREVLKLHPFLAPYKIAVLPLVKKYHSEKAREVYQFLNKHFMTNYDETGSIGKRYRRNDAIGTVYCLTVDDETLNNNIVTLRDRDSMKQININLDEVIDYVKERVNF